jgi:hypothetical protein
LFAILQVSDKNTIFSKPKIQSQRIDLPSGDVFFIVTTDKQMGRIPWKKLENCLGILRHCILLPEHITIPEGTDITAFAPDILPRIMLMNSTTDYIINRKQFFHQKNLTIFDKDGLYTSYIEKLLPYFNNIRIITDKINIYEALSEKLMTEYGFSLIVSDTENFDCDVVISQRCNVPLYFSGTVFAGEKKHLMNATVFSGSESTLPDEYENIRPNNIGRVLFASALYEKCGEKALCKLKYDNFCC